MKVNQKLVKSLQFVFFLLVGLVLLYFAFKGINLNDLMQQIKHADYRWVALSCLFALLALIFRAYRWQLLIEPLGARPKISHILNGINIGYLANFVFPRIGEITRCGILNRTDKIPVDRLFGTVIVERAFDVLMSIVLLCLILILRFEVVGNFMTENIFHPIIRKIPGAVNIKWIIIASVLILISFVVLYKVFKSQLAKISALRKIKDLAKGVLNGVKSVSEVRNIGWFAGLNILIFGMYFLQTYIMFFALSGTSSLGAGDALFVLVLSSLSFIIPVQGGIGAYHWIVSTGLTIFGLSKDDGLAYATISHSTTSLLLILAGAVSLIAVYYGNKPKKEITKTDLCLPEA